MKMGMLHIFRSLFGLCGLKPCETPRVGKHTRYIDAEVMCMVFVCVNSDVNAWWNSRMRSASVSLVVIRWKQTTSRRRGTHAIRIWLWVLRSVSAAAILRKQPTSRTQNEHKRSLMRRCTLYRTQNYLRSNVNSHCSSDSILYVEWRWYLLKWKSNASESYDRKGKHNSYGKVIFASIWTNNINLQRKCVRAEYSARNERAVAEWDGWCVCMKPLI